MRKAACPFVRPSGLIKGAYFKNLKGAYFKNLKVRYFKNNWKPILSVSSTQV